MMLGKLAKKGPLSRLLLLRPRLVWRQYIRWNQIITGVEPGQIAQARRVQMRSKSFVADVKSYSSVDPIEVCRPKASYDQRTLVM